jgi:ApaG protein
MVTAITQGIKISVDTSYEEGYSDSANEHFMFAYRIEIQNLSDSSIRLMRRKWLIFDSNGTQREVDGEGVVGEQPIINPGQSYQYVSGCNLKTEIGSMKGHYQMLRLDNETLFDVDIPEFQLIAPYKLN